MNHTYIGQTGPQSFGTAQRKTLQQFVKPDYPGPGTHQDFRLDKQKNPDWKFGNSNDRNGFLSLSSKGFPSPNKYQPNPELTKTAYPKYSVPKAQRLHYSVDEHSRYQYNPRFNCNKQRQPAWPFGYQEETDYSTKVPPPNSYFEQPLETERFNKQTDKLQRTENFFTRSHRPSPPFHEQGKSPGVGQYSIAQSLGGTSYKFGFGNRADFLLAKDSPGVFYDIEGQARKRSLGKGFTLRKKYPIIQDKDGKDFPSPDAYNPTIPKSGKNIISYRGSRSTMHNKQILRFPSPVKYAHPVDISLQNKGKAQSFTISQRQSPKSDETPAPGQYKIEGELGKTSGFMGKKLKPRHQDNTPAPSCYTPIDQLTTPTAQRPINLYSNRADFTKSYTGKKVGPGSYLKQTKWERAELGKLSKSLKLHSKDKKVPGPGSYEIPGAFGKLPKYYCLPRKLDQNGNVLENSIVLRQTDRNERMKRFEQTLKKIQTKRPSKSTAK